MLQSKNKETGERLSIIPEYIKLHPELADCAGCFCAVDLYTGYGKQEPKKYDYQGNRGSATMVSPYSIVGLSATTGCDEKRQPDRRCRQPVRQTSLACG